MPQLQSQWIVAMVMSFALQAIKRAAWFPLLTERTDKIIKVAWSALVAAGSAFAITFAYDPTLGQIIITGVTWAHMWNGLVAFLTSLLVQHGTYRVLIEPREDARRG